VISYIRRKNPAEISFVCMGYEGHTPTQEDTFFAEYVRDNLLGKKVDFEKMKEILRTGDGARLLNPANHEWSPSTDFDLCLDLNRFNFVLFVEKGADYYWLRKI
jgi:2-phosphosulfolactate phosphatase